MGQGHGDGIGAAAARRVRSQLATCRGRGRGMYGICTVIANGRPYTPICMNTAPESAYAECSNVRVEQCGACRRRLGADRPCGRRERLGSPGEAGAAHDREPGEPRVDGFDLPFRLTPVTPISPTGGAAGASTCSPESPAQRPSLVPYSAQGGWRKPSSTQQTEVKPQGSRGRGAMNRLRRKTGGEGLHNARQRRINGH